MSRIYVCDFCGKHDTKAGTGLGEGFDRYIKGLYGQEACDNCWAKLKDAFYSTEEVDVIKTRNLKSTIALLTDTSEPKQEEVRQRGILERLGFRGPKSKPRRK